MSPTNFLIGCIADYTIRGPGIALKDEYFTIDLESELGVTDFIIYHHHVDGTLFINKVMRVDFTRSLEVVGISLDGLAIAAENRRWIVAKVVRNDGAIGDMDVILMNTNFSKLTFEIVINLLPAVVIKTMMLREVAPMPIPEIDCITFYHPAFPRESPIILRRGILLAQGFTQYAIAPAAIMLSTLGITDNVAILTQFAFDARDPTSPDPKKNDARSHRAILTFDSILAKMSVDEMITYHNAVDEIRMWPPHRRANDCTSIEPLASCNISDE